MKGLSVGWLLAGMAWSSVAQEPLWVGALGGAVFGVTRWWVVRKRKGCLGCLVSSVWSYPIALVGFFVWLGMVVS